MSFARVESVIAAKAFREPFIGASTTKAPVDIVGTGTAPLGGPVEGISMLGKYCIVTFECGGPGRQAESGQGTRGWIATSRSATRLLQCGRVQKTPARPRAGSGDDPSQPDPSVRQRQTNP